VQLSGPPSSASHLSPDGLWRWDGTRWVANTGQAAATSKTSRSWLAGAGAIVAIIGASTIIAACFLPFAHCAPSSTSGCWTEWPSVFSGGFPGAWGNVAEPVLVILLAVSAAVLIIASTNRTARAFSAGALLVLGAQTFMLFVGYLAAGAGTMQLAAGGFVGLFGSILLAVGGAMSAASLLARQAPGSSS
jgi:hypothetical protein